jgi:hypothetical protein
MRHINLGLTVKMPVINRQELANTTESCSKGIYDLLRRNEKNILPC